MPQNMEDSRHMSMRGEAKDISRREDDLDKKKMAVASKSKVTPTKKAKIDEVEWEIRNMKKKFLLNSEIMELRPS